MFSSSHTQLSRYRHEEGNEMGLKEVWVLPQNKKAQKEIPIIV